MQTGDGGDTEIGWLRVNCGDGTLRIGDGGETEIGQRSTGAADVRGVVVASAGQGPLGRPRDGSDEGDVEEKWASKRGGIRATRSDAGGGEGEGSAGAAGVLTTRSLVGVLCRMSQICCFALGGNWARVSG